MKSLGDGTETGLSKSSLPRGIVLTVQPIHRSDKGKFYLFLRTGMMGTPLGRLVDGVEPAGVDGWRAFREHGETTQTVMVFSGHFPFVMVERAAFKEMSAGAFKKKFDSVMPTMPALADEDVDPSTRAPGFYL